MPIIQAWLLEGRDAETKEKFIAAVTEAAVTSLKAPRESVRVIITEMPGTHFGIAGESYAAKRRREAGDP
ncbi:2-hydroxymuconate tautomerase family protein [Novosphingobium sp. Fuku2-ISO-50]|jgi:4-oxalocrotonate tautomerase|uniref:2-hydroxymuconate tautomerase family protein n=1 Tax=Novosphingobium sp. Fuku2-ISO-50 TaxID=1739114 RepID=UPI00076D2F48|nr:2-hydroxymuconate tautomerase family protein [Novosphingobium sp. Fuku2-ISO-50]KUR76761.1 hypothetical protein AQZ50_12915 [Novosphingobium sp. Fuku2-ISO-50]